mgnify:FL=1
MLYPSTYICRSLARIHPFARLGWDAEGERFALVRLIPSRAVDSSFKEPWGQRGPIFSKRGSIAPDWDPLARAPMYEIDLAVDDVYSGRIVRLLRRWMGDPFTRIYRSALEAGRDREARTQAASIERGEHLYRRGQSSGAGAPVVAKKFIRPTMNQARYHAGELDFTHSMIPPAPSGGWARHLNAPVEEVQ